MLSLFRDGRLCRTPVLHTSVFRIVCIALVYAITTMLSPTAHARADHHAQTIGLKGDSTITAMYEAFQRKDNARLQALLPKVRGHMLEPYAAYWELTTRIDTATEADVNRFTQRWANTYWEDRLRNDWLRELAKRESWGTFLRHEAQFRMQDDRTVRCHTLRLGAKEATAAARAERAYENWLRAANKDKACTRAIAQFYRQGLLQPHHIWQRAALAMPRGRLSAAVNAASIVSPSDEARIKSLYRSPERFIQQNTSNRQASTPYLISLALIRLAQKDPDRAAQLLNGSWRTRLNTQQASWAWAEIARNAAKTTNPLALRYFGNADDAYLSDLQLAWKARATMQAGLNRHAQTLVDAFNHMSEKQREKPVWQYWLGKALHAQGKAGQAQALWQKTALEHPLSYYGQLSAHALGQPMQLPAPAQPAAEDRAWVQHNTGLQRALYAIHSGIRHWGVREWNYHLRLFSPEGATDGQALAAAESACAQDVWDRCITSATQARPLLRTDFLYPQAHASVIAQHSRGHGLPAYYAQGLIRQESLYVTDARSHVGAGGLMQLMPATARWTAKKAGLKDYNQSMRNDPSTNVLLGTYYFNKVYTDLDQSLPLTLAGYNAGPNRARRWREKGTSDATVWVETIPFQETRQYVQKVTANMVVYARLNAGSKNATPTLPQLLGTITPATHEYNAQLP